MLRSRAWPCVSSHASNRGAGADIGLDGLGDDRPYVETVLAGDSLQGAGLTGPEGDHDPLHGGALVVGLGAVAAVPVAEVGPGHRAALGEALRRALQDHLAALQEV